MNQLYLVKIKSLIFKKKIRRLLKSPFKFLGAVSFLTLSFWGMFFLIVQGFNFLNELGGVGTVIFERLFYIFFFSLFWMLVISSGIMFYVCAFRMRDSLFFLSLPVKTDVLVSNKFAESAALSSWGFLFAIIPFIFAYGSLKELTFSYYFISLLYIIPFIGIANIVGAVITLAIISICRLRIFKHLVIVLSLIILYFLLRPGATPQEGTFIFISRLNPLFNISLAPFSVYFWASEGLRSLERGFFFKGAIYLSCLYSSLFAGFIFLKFLAKKMFYYCFQQVNFISPKKKKVRTAAIDNFLYRFLKPRWLSAFLLKDMKMFFRDPLQWSQSLMFFGFLLLYAANLRNFSYHLMDPLFKNMVTFLNIFAASGVLSSLGIRYVYPQLSLEGANFWILGLSPVSLKKILGEKFLFSFVPNLFICEAVILISNLNLGIPPLLFFASAVLVFIVTLGIISICLGLGAYFADFSTMHNFQVISEFGGIAALIFNLLYLTLTVAGMGAIFHLHLKGLLRADLRLLAASYLVLIFIGTGVVSAFSLGSGYQALRSKEY